MPRMVVLIVIRSMDAMLSSTAPRLYNLLPDALGAIDGWAEQLPSIREMNFDILSLAPFQETATPGDTFSVKDHWSLAARHRPVSSNLDDSSLIAHFVAAARESGLRVMIDCVLTHTARDADLRASHPEWFVQDGIDFLSISSGPGESTTARIDWGYGSRDAIREYFLGVIRHYATLGIEGFRCPAASMVPSEVWADLIADAKAFLPACFFCVEALGRPETELRRLRGVGFDSVSGSKLTKRYATVSVIMIK